MGTQNVVLNWVKRLDYDLSFMFYSSIPKTNRIKTYLKSLEYSCHGIPWLMIVAILIFTYPNSKIIANLFVGLILDIIYVALAKALSRRRRPTFAPQDDQLIVASIDKHSFPSGHASRAIYVALYLGDGSIVSLVIWLWAFAVCISRVLLGRHHIGDVIAGVILGYFEFISQFTIALPLSTLFLWITQMLFGVKFSNTNDVDIDTDI